MMVNKLYTTKDVLINRIERKQIRRDVNLVINGYL